MRITHAYISKSLRHFRTAFFEKYGLTEVNKINRPVVLFGLYRTEDYQFYRTHKGPITVVWCGGESGRISGFGRKIILSKPARHIATSQRISYDLKKHGIHHQVLPISPAKVDLKPVPVGDKIYCYYGNENTKAFYGYGLAREVEKETGIPVIYATYNTFDRDELINVYKDCFLGLRLTPRDGVSVTVVELGMMGRRCVFNGDSPNSVIWKPDNLVDVVKREYKDRHYTDVDYISKTVKSYLSVNEDWLLL